jgi:hypothetical protein
MARLVLTNNKSKLNMAIKRNINAGFGDYSQYVSNKCFLAMHKKRIKKIENFIEKPNGDFCCIAGTGIYMNATGEEALDFIYRDFENDIESIRKKIIGNYVIAIKKNNRIVVFVDKYQVLKVYYYNIDGNWFITNSLADIGNVLDQINIHEYSFIQETMLAGTIGTQAIFQNVFRLFGHQYIEIDCRDNHFTIKEMPYSRKRRNFDGRSIESAVSEYADIVRAKFAIVANIFGSNIRIHQTGGLDNRTVFSAFMAVGCKPGIVYGIGNSIITSTKNEDLLICKEFQKIFRLDFYEMNWKENYLDGYQHWSDLFNRYGFSVRIYGGNRNFFNEYEGRIPEYPDFMECGYFLENLRLREWALKRRKEKFTIDEFVDEYLLGGAYGAISGNKNFYPQYNIFKDYLVGEFKKYISLYQISEDNQISLNTFDQVRWIHSRNCDSAMVNFLNEFAPSIAMFSLPELHEFPFDVPAAWRANGRFQVMLINELYPNALSIPIFSHCKRQVFSRNDFSLKAENSFARSAKEILNKFSVPKYVRNILKLLYIKSMPDKNRMEAYKEEIKLKEMIVSIIKENEQSGTFVSPDLYKGSLVWLMIYAQYLHGIRLLQEK